MVLNLYSCALRGVDVIYALCAFNEPILVDERVWCGGGCGFGEGWHGCDMCERTGAPPLVGGGCPGPLVWVCCGGVLLSHNLSVAVPLALPGLASRFGMEAGRFPGAVTTTSFVVQSAPPLFAAPLVLWGGLWGVWVDRGSYSGCGRVPYTPPVWGLCVV